MRALGASRQTFGGKVHWHNCVHIDAGAVKGTRERAQFRTFSPRRSRSWRTSSRSPSACSSPTPPRRCCSSRSAAVGRPIRRRVLREPLPCRTGCALALSLVAVGVVFTPRLLSLQGGGYTAGPYSLAGDLWLSSLAPRRAPRSPSTATRRCTRQGRPDARDGALVVAGHRRRTLPPCYDSNDPHDFGVHAAVWRTPPSSASPPPTRSPSPASTSRCSTRRGTSPAARWRCHAARSRRRPSLHLLPLR